MAIKNIDNVAELASGSVLSYAAAIEDVEGISANQSFPRFHSNCYWFDNNKYVCCFIVCISSIAAQFQTYWLLMTQKIIDCEFFRHPNTDWWGAAALCAGARAFCNHNVRFPTIATVLLPSTVEQCVHHCCRTTTPHRTAGGASRWAGGHRLVDFKISQSIVYCLICVVYAQLAGTIERGKLSGWKLIWIYNDKFKVIEFYKFEKFWFKKLVNIYLDWNFLCQRWKYCLTCLLLYSFCS